MSLLVRRAHVVLSTAGFKGGGNPCRKTRETSCAAERHPENPVHLAGFELSHWRTSSALLPIGQPVCPVR